MVEDKNNSNDMAESQSNEPSLDQIFDPETPRMARWVIKYSGGIVKDERQASYVLIGFVVLAIIFSLFMFFNQNKTPDVRLEDFKNREQFIP